VRRVSDALALLDGMVSGAAARGLLMLTAEDRPLDGRSFHVAGRELVNFGSCSYLGLEHHPHITEAVGAAAKRYGSQFSASRTYVQAPGYPPLEERLREIFGGHVLVAPSTTLGHKIALPAIVAPQDAALLDHQVHHSVQRAADHLRAQTSTVKLLRHSDMDELEREIVAHARTHRHVWYLLDGLYSMFADVAPFEELERLLERHDQLRLYVDDAHGIGWAGERGRGLALERLGVRERVVVAGSLNKSFAAAGGVLVFGTAELRRRARTLGGPMIFSGPIQPPMLAAALASAEIHLSPELPERQAALRERIDYCNALLEEHGLRPTSDARVPIRYVELGLPVDSEALMAALLDAGIYVNLGIFPAVPMKRSGLRFTLTNHLRLQDIELLVATLAELAQARARSAAGAPDRRSAWTVTSTPLRLEHHRSCEALPAREWDPMLGSRGTFSVAGLRLLEETFNEEATLPEDQWRWHYYLVRDARGRVLAATFFTAALWKQDMLDRAALSRRVERERLADSYFLTAQTFAMGSLLTEGDHLFLDRAGDWRGALDLLVETVGEHAAQEGAGTIVFRDLAAGDGELAAALSVRGFARVEMPAAYAIDPLAADRAAWLASLSYRSRRFQLREVMPFDSHFEVEVLRRGGRTPGDAELEHLYGLYRNVHARNHDLNTFPLPLQLFPRMLAHDCWELLLLYRTGEVSRRRPLAFAANFRGARHYVPLVVGLDYEHLHEHASYRQALSHSIMRALDHGAQFVPLGIGAGVEKRRFGATAHARCAFAQTDDHYSQELLAALDAESD
jgi:7-keto-8-aminopelargonate synthetase-like enzyme